MGEGEENSEKLGMRSEELIQNAILYPMYGVV